MTHEGAAAMPLLLSTLSAAAMMLLWGSMALRFATQD